MSGLDLRRCGRWRNPSLTNPRVHRLRLRTIIFADKDKKGAPDRDGPGKADFSAYWSLKIREFFDSRKR